MTIHQEGFIYINNHEHAEKNKNIVFLSADFGAPALDSFRLNLAEQFYHLGISEQNMVDVAIGLAERGKKYSVMLWPLHIYEMCRTTQNCCYDETTHNKYYSWSWFKLTNAGPTHYSTEDLALL